MPKDDSRSANLNQVERAREIHRLIDRFTKNPKNDSLRVTDEILAQKLEVSDRQIRRDRELLLRWIGEGDERKGFFHEEDALYFDKKAKSWRYRREVDLSAWVGRLDEEELGALIVAQQALAVFSGMPLARHIKTIFEEDASGICGGKRSVLREEITNVISFYPDGAGKIDPDQFITVFRGLILQQALAVTYQGRRREQPSDRILEPLHLACLRNQWRLIAHDSKHGKIRSFVVTPRRLRKVKLLSKSFQRPKDFNPLHYLVHRKEEGVTAVTLRISAQGAHHILERSWVALKACRELPRGVIEADFEVGDLGEFERLILAFGKDCEVLRPESLRSRILEEAEAMVRKYRSPADEVVEVIAPGS